MEKEKLEKLRIFFRVSNAAFDFASAISSATGHPPLYTKMQHLHKMAKDELEKEDPDMGKIDFLLSQMEELARQNNLPKPDFPKGGE